MDTPLLSSDAFEKLQVYESLKVEWFETWPKLVSYELVAHWR